MAKSIEFSLSESRKNFSGPIHPPAEHQAGCTAAHRAGTSPCTVQHPLTDARIDALAQDHAAALLDNLPCELCGRIEQHPNHRGIGHTHTPAVTFVDRAALFLNTTTDPSGHIADAARMILGTRNPREIIDVEHAAALVEYRRVLAGRRLDRRCDQCGPGADHSNRAHDGEFDGTQRTPDLARIAADPDTPAYVAESARMMAGMLGRRVVFETDHHLALRYDLPCDDCGPEADHTNGAHVDLVAQLAAANEQL